MQDDVARDRCDAFERQCARFGIHPPWLTEAEMREREMPKPTWNDVRNEIGNELTDKILAALHPKPRYRLIGRMGDFKGGSRQGVRMLFGTTWVWVIGSKFYELEKVQ